MIHIDIARDPDEIGAGRVQYPYPKLLMQTSTDGAGWKTHYLFYVDVTDAYERGAGYARKQQENRAADAARIFAAGCEYATGDRPRMTMFGYHI